jgi:hypothetical protein
LIGWSVATARILKLRRLGYSLRLHESAAAPTYHLRRRDGLAGGASTFAGLSSRALI